MLENNKKIDTGTPGNKEIVTENKNENTILNNKIENVNNNDQANVNEKEKHSENGNYKYFLNI